MAGESAALETARVARHRAARGHQYVEAVEEINRPDVPNLRRIIAGLDRRAE